MAEPGQTDTSATLAGLGGPQLGGLFGETGIQTQAGYEMRGNVLTGEGTPGPHQYAPTLFGPENMQMIVDSLQNPPTMGESGDWARETVGGLDSLQGLFDSYQQSAGQQWGNLEEGMETGFRVDMDPIIKQAMNRLYNETIPGISEGFAGTSGLASSDFGRALTDAGRDVEIDLGLQQYEADEKAAQRRAGFTELAPQMAAQLLGGPTGFAAQVSELENYQRQLKSQTDPGAALYQQLMAMSGIDTQPATIVAPDTSTTKTEKAAAAMKNIFMPSLGGPEGPE